ncbi:MurT ligase domain-containing protein [Curtobacterium sp. SORGH_AS_0776]|uniref:MurT ligase domain-containing protein n=1 Tax=Curtobacterium sp. SORGH_AS_0776 TaxID=3041798 RepID=UPI002856B62B|nr:MurT ligase domain-containing protein [Curtobacterium sp. SORGH_AS_0776]MDR6171453.1 UDP-N-acetylmuramyl tripeptide synthase [Curtobacterium sp. SORGH_AS_0776]
MRFVIPILVGRILRALARARGGGSAYPGYIVLKLVPNFLQHVTAQFPNGVVFVLGSNGKSTTTHMISDIVRAHGLRVFTNPSGANLPQGIASALLSEVSLTGKLKADIGILEVDEAFAVELAGILSPSTVTMLNVQVDQLYRFFETERVATMMLDTAALSTANVITNRDDQFLDAYVGTDGQRVLRFGASAEVVAAAPNGLQNADDFDRQDAVPNVADAEVVVNTGDGATIRFDGAEISVRLPARGLHYAVDAAAATATASAALGAQFRADAVTSAFGTMKPAYGRGERLPIAGESAEFTMFKNAASLQLNLDALPDHPEQVLMAIDEGTPDISWIYDIDFSKLDHVDVVSGDKAWQIAIALEHAGVRIGRVEPDVEAAIKQMEQLGSTTSGTKNFIVNYEIMMIARKALGHPDMEKTA